MIKTNPDNPKSPPLVRKVNADNYGRLAKPFITANMSRVICRLPIEPVEDDTRRQWGAWLSYFLRHRIPARLMGELNEYMVPTEWPHMFDSDETVQHDFKCGEAFMALTIPGERSVFLVPDMALGFIARKA